jgi:hypothetical protein
MIHYRRLDAILRGGEPGTLHGFSQRQMEYTQTPIDSAVPGIKIDWLFLLEVGV